MKKLLIALMLIANSAIAQNTITWFRITRDTVLSTNPFSTTNTIKTGYYNINPRTGIQNRWSGSAWVSDTLFKTTVVNNTTTNITGSSSMISPEMFGAVNANQTFAQRGISQDTINSRYPGIGATINDNIDWAAWQMAVRQACLIGGGVHARGGTYFIGSKPIVLEKLFRGIQIDGNMCKIISNGGTSIISRVTPVSNSEANQMVESKVTIQNIFLEGTSSQIGIDIGPTYGSLYQNIYCSGLAEAIHLRFGLRTIINNCFATYCNKGWVVDRGNWTGSSNSNSQSNHTTISNCRWFGNGDVAIQIIACSGCVVRDCIIEGQSCRVGIEWDGQGSTVVKDGTVENCHFECSSGSTESFIKVRLHSGIITINKAYGQYASILVDAGATIGYLNVRVSNVPFWVMKVGKAFNNAGNCSWVFEGNDSPLYTNTPSTTVPTWFTGTSVSLCSNGGCGSNRFFYYSIPR
jgi:hypothetical protein